MTSMQPASRWRGYVNQILYGLNLRQRVTDTDITWLVNDMIRQRTFTQPVSSYYEATAAALESSERISHRDEDDDEVARDFLTRLLQVLDARRPWPEPPFHKGDPSEWPDFRNAPVIARIPLTQMKVEERLNRGFFKIPSNGDTTRALILRLRTGQEVALVAPASITEAGIDLLARTDPTSTVAAFRELTGIEVEPGR